VRTCICFKNIRAVYPFSDKRIADTFFGLSAEVRHDVLSRVGWSGTRSCRLAESTHADGDMINVKTPDGFSTTIRVYTFRVRFRTNDDIVY
jgi:hypothetical protein